MIYVSLVCFVLGLILVFRSIFGYEEIKADNMWDRGLLALLRLQFLESKKRYEQLFSKGHLKNVYVFVSRISCTEGIEQKETANSVTYCWCHFDRDYVGQPTLHWIQIRGIK